MDNLKTSCYAHKALSVVTRLIRNQNVISLYQHVLYQKSGCKWDANPYLNQPETCSRIEALQSLNAGRL